MSRPVTRVVVVAGVALAVLASASSCQSIAGLGDFHPAGGPSTSGQGGDGSGGHGQGGDGEGGEGPGHGGSGGEGAGQGGDGTPSSTTATTSTGGGCNLDHLVLSEVRTRGPGGGNEDFIEILNATASTVTLTSAFRVEARGDDSATYGTRWTGDGNIILAPGARALLANNARGNPLGGALPDAIYDSGIPDGASVVLYQGDQVLDALCFTCGLALGEDYVCEGTPLTRGSTCSENGDTSVQRRPASSVDGCTDTDDGAADLEEGPSTPQGNG